MAITARASTHTSRTRVSYGTLLEGDTGRHKVYGGDEFTEIIQVKIDPGYQMVNVQMSGWDLNFSGDDGDKVDRICMKIIDTDYNPSSGQLRFKINGSYQNPGEDLMFRWQVWFSILAFE